MAAARKFWAERENHPVGFKQKPDNKHTPHDSGLSVGAVDSALIQELQEEVRSLTERVSTDSQRFANYENEIHELKNALKQERNKNEVKEEATSPLSARPVTPSVSRFGSFMRKPVTSPGEAPSNREKELEIALAQEQNLRVAAEKKIRDMDNELEELSSNLFQQANDMVSVERREKAALKDRIQTLEQSESKVTHRVRALEQREVDRNRRMEKLEGAIIRIEKARSLLVPR